MKTGVLFPGRLFARSLKKACISSLKVLRLESRAALTCARKLSSSRNLALRSREAGPPLTEALSSASMSSRWKNV